MTSFFLLARFDPSNNAGPLMEHLAKSSHSFVVGQNYEELAKWAGLTPGAPSAGGSSNKKQNKGNKRQKEQNETEGEVRAVLSSISLAVDAQERVSSDGAQSAESEPLFSNDLVKEEIVDEKNYEPIYVLGEKSGSGQADYAEEELEGGLTIDEYNGGVVDKKTIGKLADLVGKTRRSWQCPVPSCGATILLKCGLVRHVKEKHPGERPFWCSECPAKFDREDNMKRHEKRHASFTCNSCQVDFASAHSLTRHEAQFRGLPHVFCKLCQVAIHLSDCVDHQKEFHKGE